MTRKPDNVRGSNIEQPRTLEPGAPLSLCLTAGAALLAYLPTLRFDLVWDDPMLLKLVEARFQNAGVWGLLSSEFLLGPGGASTGYYRPLVLLSLFLDGRLGGGAPWVYHATNLVLHAGCSVLVLLLARGLLPSVGALAAALVFALHPAHVEAVAFIAGRTDLWAALLVLAAVLLWQRCWGRGDGAFGWTGVASTLCFLLAALAKELALLTPAVLLVWETLSGSRKTPAIAAKDRWRRILSWLVLWAGAVAVLVCVRLGVARVGWGAPPDAAVPTTNPSSPWLAMLRIVGYLRLLILPWPLSPYYTSSDFAPAPLWTAGAAAAVAAIAAGCLLLCHRNGWKGAAWIGVFIAPVLGFLPIDAAVLAERFVYLPSVGFCLILGGLYALARGAWKPALCDGLAVVLLACCAAGTLIGQRPWRDDKTLSARIVRTSPQAFVGHLNLGNSLAREGRIGEAEAEYRAAVAIAPARADAWNNLGAVLEQRGDEAGAVEAFRKASILAPQAEMFSLNLANSLVRLGHADEAEAIFRRLLAQDATSRPARLGLADALESGRKYREAAEVLLPATGTGDDDGGISLRCARLYRQAGETGKTGEMLRRAVSIRPSDASLLIELGTFMADQGRAEEARSLLSRAARTAPDRADARSYLGFVLLSGGRTAEAVVELREAKRLDPRNPVVRLNLGLALLAEERIAQAREEVRALRALNPEMSRQLEREIERPRPRR